MPCLPNLPSPEALSTSQLLQSCYKPGLCHLSRQVARGAHSQRVHAQQDGAAKGRRLVDYNVFLNEVWRPMTRRVTGSELKQALKEGQLPPARVSGYG